MSEHHTTETDEIEDFSPDDLKYLAVLAEKVAALTEWAGRRLVVEAWSKDDQKPVAWVECYPGDSHAAVTFTHPHPDRVVTYLPAKQHERDLLDGKVGEV